MVGLKQRSSTLASHWNDRGVFNNPTARSQAGGSCGNGLGFWNSPLVIPVFGTGSTPLFEGVSLPGSALYPVSSFSCCFPAWRSGQGSEPPFTSSVILSFHAGDKTRMYLCVLFIYLFVVDIPRLYVLLRRGIGNGDHVSCGNYWPYARAAFSFPLPPAATSSRSHGLREQRSKMHVVFSCGPRCSCMMADRLQSYASVSAFFKQGYWVQGPNDNTVTKPQPHFYLSLHSH